MAVLVIADHDGKQLKPGVTNTITAATKMGDPVVVLVAGDACAAADSVLRHPVRWSRASSSVTSQKSAARPRPADKRYS